MKKSDENVKRGDEEVGRVMKGVYVRGHGECTRTCVGAERARARTKERKREREIAKRCLLEGVGLRVRGFRT